MGRKFISVKKYNYNKPLVLKISPLKYHYIIYKLNEKLIIIIQTQPRTLSSFVNISQYNLQRQLWLEIKGHSTVMQMKVCLITSHYPEELTMMDKTVNIKKC